MSHKNLEHLVCEVIRQWAASSTSEQLSIQDIYRRVHRKRPHLKSSDSFSYSEIVHVFKQLKTMNSLSDAQIDCELKYLIQGEIYSSF